MKKITKFDIVIIFTLFILGLSSFKLSQTSGEKSIKLIIEDKIVYIPFEDKFYDLNKDYNVDIIIEVKDKKARMVHSSCYGKQCIRAGWVSECGESAICMPNKTALQIECKESEIDAISQ